MKLSRSFLRNIMPPLLCLVLAAAGAFIFFRQGSPASTAVENRKLPIYCVSTEKLQVSISFDAAWGNAS